MYAIPKAGLDAAGLVAATPCGLDIAGDNEASRADLDGVVVGETSVSVLGGAGAACCGSTV